MPVNENAQAIMLLTISFGKGGPAGREATIPRRNGMALPFGCGTVALALRTCCAGTLRKCFPAGLIKQ